jgi:hypothetical protein
MRREALSADLIVTGPTGGFPHSVATAAAHLAGVGATTTVYRGSVVGLSTDRLADTVILAMQAGRSTTALAGGQLLIDTTTAQNDHLAVGSIVPVTFALTGTSTMRVGGIFEPNAFIGSYLVGGRFFLSHFSNPLPIGVLVRSKTGAANVDRTVNALLNPYPNVGVRTGMEQRQIRAMVRSEAVIPSLFGAAIGVVVGTGLGTALVASLQHSHEITVIVLPFGRLVVFLLMAAGLGLGAAAWPARRAARLDVLAAIATE